MLDPWQYALALLTGTLTVQVVAWPPERRRVVRLLDGDEPSPRPPKPVRRTRPPRPRPIRQIKPKCSTPTPPRVSQRRAPKPAPAPRPPRAAPRPPRVPKPPRTPKPRETRLPSHDEALAAMLNAEPMLVTGLAVPLGISKYAARRLMRRLEGAGLVRRAVQGWVAVRAGGVMRT